MQQPGTDQLVRRCGFFLCCPGEPGGIGPCVIAIPETGSAAPSRAALLTYDPAGGMTRGASFSVRAVFGSTLGLEGTTTA
jgi:hypothetical protein